MSTLFVNNLNTASGSTITVPTGKQLIVTDEGGVRVPGSVIQVVHATDSSGQTSTGGQSYVDTGLSCNITPKFSTSKVLVIVGQPLMMSTATTAAREIYYRIVRGSTGLIEGGSQFDLTHSNAYQSTGWFNGLNFLDSPATTSTTTYKTQFYISGGTSDVYCNYGGTNGSMVLMEIAQ